jgi:alkylation response protein AidB-like acyl-CoA dehydrogenase
LSIVHTVKTMNKTWDRVSDCSVRDETHEVLRTHAAKAEQADRLAAESLDALREDGVFALRTPRDHGGAWAGTEAIARCLAGLARSCPSTAWIAGTNVTAKNLTVRSFQDSLPDVFADPDALCCGSGSPNGQGERVPEGIRIGGRWPNASGCEDAAWAMVALMVDGQYSLAVVPGTDLAVDPTWHMAGMRATGSHTLVAEDLVAPAERVVAASVPPIEDAMLYALTVLATVVGAARGALDAINAMFASDRKPFMSEYSRMGESPGARHWLAEATHLVSRAEDTMIAVAQMADSPELSAADGPRLRMDIADAGRDCRAAVDLMLDLHGASGFNTANVLQRFWRDVAVSSRHPHLNPYLSVEAFGKQLAEWKDLT